MVINESHRDITQERGYIYIGTYEVNEILKDSNKNRKTSVPIMRIKCPYCGKEYDIRVASFKHSKSKCTYCCNKYENSFAYYIQQELKEPLNKYWDWEKNTVNPYLISKKSNKKVKIKVNNKMYTTLSRNAINVIERSLKEKASVIHPKDSFAQYHIDNTDPNFLEKYWSNKNVLDPWKIPPSSSKIKVMIKDLNGKEKSISCNHLSQITQNRKNIIFKSTISFAQWGVDKLGDDFLEKYWSDKNTLDPWKISCGSDKKVWMKCQKKDYHYDYLVSSYKFSKRGYRCPQCSHKGKSLHVKDSFGSLYDIKAKYWSPRNKRSPYEVYPHSREKCWFICENCHREFNMTMEILNSNPNNDEHVFCDRCRSSQGESRIIDHLNSTNITYYYDRPYFKDLLSINGYPLRPDFILPDLKIWIEYDGGQHYEWIPWMMTYENFETLQKNDEIKNRYAKEHDWKLIRIPYWDFENIEEILNREL